MFGALKFRKQARKVQSFNLTKCTIYIYYIAGKFGRELNLVVWRSILVTPKLKSANILQRWFRAQLPNLIPADISGYTVGLPWIESAILDVNNNFIKS